MTIGAVIQARTSSTRLPGKVLLKIKGITVLEHVIYRLKKCKTFNQIIVATSTDSSDDPIFKICKKNKLHVFRGNLNDLLERYYICAKKFKLKSIIRITADCPVIDPEIVDKIVNIYNNGAYDLCGLDGDFPDGLDCFIMSINALKKAYLNAKLISDREHVGPFILRTQNKFKVKKVKLFKNLGYHRWTLDNKEDFLLIKKIYNELYTKGKIFNTKEILDLFRKNPELLKINQNITRNEGYLNSLAKDYE